MALRDRAYRVEQIHKRTDLPQWLKKQMITLVLDTDRHLDVVLGNLELAYLRVVQGTEHPTRPRKQRKKQQEAP